MARPRVFFKLKTSGSMSECDPFISVSHAMLYAVLAPKQLHYVNMPCLANVVVWNVMISPLPSSQYSIESPTIVLALTNC
jgi:hypothetical protein